MMNDYLRSTDIIDWQAPAVFQLARALAENAAGPLEIARNCFQRVRDGVRHSGDAQSTITTCRASEVLEHGAGWCFAKSHLLAALLRANGVPAGFCYQRLCRDDGNGFTLHGLNAVFLPETGWYRMDARGNKPGVDARFCPPEEKLAFLPQEEGELDFPEIWPDPAPIVVESLKRFAGWERMAANLPDVPLARLRTLPPRRPGGREGDL